MQPTIQEIQGIFFEAMTSGWAQDAQKSEIPELPGSKTIPFVQGDFRVLDTYFVTPFSDRSSGMILIWHKNRPVWVMHFAGWYDKLAIPFLKSCLGQAYVKERLFYGGRGPTIVRDEQFTYVNRLQRNDFTDFAGEEHIHDRNQKWFGYHWYRGMSLLGDEQ